MIKITSKLYIHFLTIITAVICIFSHHAAVFAISYGVMLLHEAAHLAAATAIGLRIDRIAFYPYGVNLKLKNRFVHNLADEIILCLAGPLVNCAAALISLSLYNVYRTPYLQLFYVDNTALFLFNMLPVCPLDGGILTKRLLSYFFGGKKAALVMKIISALIVAAMVTLCVYMVYVTEFNFSVLLLTGFLICSIFTSNEKYDEDFVHEMMFYSGKKRRRIRHIIVPDGEPPEKTAKKFSRRYYSVVYTESPDGKINHIASEREIMNKLLSAHSDRKVL